MSFNSKKQLSFGDLYEQAKDWAQNDKPQFLEMLDQYLDCLLYTSDAADE